jgi:hypothetical protein
MSKRHRGLVHCTSLLVLLAWVQQSQAGRVRYHYVPVDGAGNTSLQPDAGSAGARVTRLGLTPTPYADQPRPTHLVTVQHPCSGRRITVRLTLPDSTPRMEHRPNRIIYNYGSDTVEVRFLPDGSVDVVYDSGLIRQPWSACPPPTVAASLSRFFSSAELGRR